MHYELEFTQPTCRRSVVAATLAVACLASLVPIGCDTPPAGLGPGATGTPPAAPGTFLSRRLVNASLAEVRPAATEAFRQYFRLDRDASTTNALISVPMEVTDPETPPRVRDILGTPNRFRRVAELYLQQEGGDVLARCRIQIQRLDTAERAAFARQSRNDDRPTETPIDREGAASARRIDEWTDVGRDRQSEQELLTAIETRLAGVPQEEPPLTEEPPVPPEVTAEEELNPEP